MQAMRSLALVLVVTLVGCVPMPTAAEAHYGNGLWILASSYVIQNEARRNCTLHDDMGDVDPLASAAGDSASTLATATAGVIAVAPLSGTGHTPQKTMAPSTTPRSR